VQILQAPGFVVLFFRDLVLRQAVSMHHSPILQQNIDLRYSEKEINKKTQLNAFVVF
jgi:hypothetical protein